MGNLILDSLNETYKNKLSALKANQAFVLKIVNDICEAYDCEVKHRRQNDTKSIYDICRRHYSPGLGDISLECSDKDIRVELRTKSLWFLDEDCKDLDRFKELVIKKGLELKSYSNLYDFFITGTISADDKMLVDKIGFIINTMQTNGFLLKLDNF